MVNLKRLEMKRSFFYVSSISILWQFCKCWVHQRSGRIIGTLKQKEFKCQTYPIQVTDTAGECQDKELNGQSLESVMTFSETQ